MHVCVYLFLRIYTFKYKDVGQFYKRNRVYITVRVEFREQANQLNIICPCRSVVSISELH